jgi:hypothetical protein
MNADFLRGETPTSRKEREKCGTRQDRSSQTTELRSADSRGRLSPQGQSESKITVSESVVGRFQNWRCHG